MKSVPPPLPKTTIEVNPAWLDNPEPKVVVSEMPSSAGFVDAVRVWVGPNGEVTVASRGVAPAGFVDAIVVSTALGSSLSHRFARAKR